MSIWENVNVEIQRLPLSEAPCDFEKDPAFINANEMAQKLLQEAPLPDFILKRLEKPE